MDKATPTASGSQQPSSQAATAPAGEAATVQTMPVSPSPVSPPRKVTKSAMEDLFEDMFDVDEQTETEPVELGVHTLAEIQQQLTVYKAQPQIPLTADPLEWWKLHSCRFPHMARVAKRYLGVPATSVPSERVFSTAGDIVTAKRSCLIGEHVDQLIFL